MLERDRRHYNFQMRMAQKQLKDAEADRAELKPDTLGYERERARLDALIARQKARIDGMMQQAWAWHKTE